MDNATLAAGVMADTVWTVPLPADSPLLKLVPPDATAYLALNIQWQSLFTRFTALLDAALPDSSGQHTDQVITQFAAQQKINIQTDILAHLQPIVLIHDAPQHPLRLPLMVTAIAAAEPADQESVRASFNTLIAALSSDLDRKANPRQNSATASLPIPANADFTHLRLRTDKDDVTYLQFGLVGPGWTWTQNRLLLSWSPAAVAPTSPPPRRSRSTLSPPHFINHRASLSSLGLDIYDYQTIIL